jgi:hypothetical protein
MVVTPPGETVVMARQLRLLDPVEDQWRIDETTRQIGLAGVRAAREALRSVRPVALADPSVEHPDAASSAA